MSTAAFVMGAVLAATAAPAPVLASGGMRNGPPLAPQAPLQDTRPEAQGVKIDLSAYRASWAAATTGYEEGLALLARRDYAAAERQFRATITTAPPHFYWPHVGLGDALMGQKRYAEALYAYDYVAKPERRPGVGLSVSESPEFLVKYAVALYYTGRKAEARETYARAVGPILFEAGGSAPAGSYAKSAVPASFDPSTMTGRQFEAAARTAAALTFVRRGQHAEAAIEAWEALRLSPGSAVARYCLGQALIASDPDAGMREIRSAEAEGDDRLKQAIRFDLPRLQAQAEKVKREQAEQRSRSAR